MSATQKVRIVNMDEMSDDGKSEVDPDEEVEQLEAEAEALEEDVESQQKKHVDEVARWGVVLVGEDELSGKCRGGARCSAVGGMGKQMNDAEQHNLL